MDSQPPNDPNRNNNGVPQKEVPYDGRSRRNAGQNQGDAPMDIIGDLSDSPAVVIMFLIGVASWFLRERCAC
jgi:hypothetical protein